MSIYGDFDFAESLVDNQGVRRTFGGFDSPLAVEVASEACALSKARGMTAVKLTHDLSTTQFSFSQTDDGIMLAAKGDCEANQLIQALEWAARMIREQYNFNSK